MGKNLNQINQIEAINGEEKMYTLQDSDDYAMTVNQLKQFILDNSEGSDYVTLKGDDGVTYRAFVQNGKIKITLDEAFTGDAAQPGQNTSIYDGLVINQMYGAGTDAGTTTPVSHSFIELYNYREDYTLNLKGLYLWYRAKAGQWESLKLEGVVPPKHSFLIRCKQQMDPYDPSVTVPVLDYDMEWDKALSNEGFSIYLCIGNTKPADCPVRKTYDETGKTVVSVDKNFIDLLGAGGKLEDQTIWAYEGKGIISLQHDSYLHCMDKNTGVRRVDYANGGTKNIGSNGLVKGNNEADCEAIDYTNCDTDVYRPRSLSDGRWTEFFDKLKQSATTPSMVNISYGKEGDTSRCFCFHTPVTHEGYVYYKKESDQFWNVAETSIQIVKDMDGCTAVHKVKLSSLTNGIYEYKVGYEGCWSDVATFEVKSYSQSGDTIKMLWTSDQQSWTNREYDVWKVAARFLRQNNGYRNYDFHLNTGDISQNANRSFEWHLYYNYAGELTKNIPHMITCGNNDLISKKFSDAYSHYIYEDDKFANSVYAYDLGFTHFVCLNSNTDSTYVNKVGTVGGYSSTDAFLEAQMSWFDQHMTQVNARSTKPRWVIVYAHLSPFTVGRTIRLQRWVSHFEKWKIDLVLCGHNHAYSRSKSLNTGYDFNQSASYNDYVTKQDGSTALKIVDEFKADGLTEIDRTDHTSKHDGVVYLLNHACGFKLSGKEKPITLPSNLQGTKHDNGSGMPWWIVKQGLPTNPLYCTLNIQYNKIDFIAYQITGIVSYDDNKNTIINEDLSKVKSEIYDQLTINYDEQRHQ